MAIKATPSFSLNDQLFNAASVGELAAGLSRADPGFPSARFSDEVLAGFPDRALKERIHWMVSVLASFLPETFEDALATLGHALPPPLDATRKDDDFGKFIWVVPGEYVAKHGCTPETLGRSLEFLRESTQRFSAEWAIRPFLRDFPGPTMAFARDCTGHAHYHVRRLASEGIRPFLPWGERVVRPVDEIIDVLDRLHGDATRFVTRSVANTLNDLSRIEPDAVLSALDRWQSLGVQQADELQWMMRHSLRTLARTDHGDALKLLGYSMPPRYAIINEDTDDRVTLGGRFRWCCTLQSQARQRLKVALRIHYLKANGSHKPRTFAVGDMTVDDGESVDIDKAVVFRAMTTRTLYAGTHFAELVVNGVVSHRRTFEFVP